MRSNRPAKLARFLALPSFMVIVMLVAVHAGESGHHDRVINDPSVGYAVPIQRVYQFPAALVFQPTSSWGYAVPIQRVYQFPAAVVFQPGPETPFRMVPGSSYDQYGGPSFIPR